MPVTFIQPEDLMPLAEAIDEAREHITELAEAQGRTAQDVGTLITNVATVSQLAATTAETASTLAEAVAQLSEEEDPDLTQLETDVTALKNRVTGAEGDIASLKTADTTFLTSLSAAWQAIMEQEAHDGAQDIRDDQQDTVLAAKTAKDILQDAIDAAVEARVATLEAAPGGGTGQGQIEVAVPYQVLTNPTPQQLSDGFDAWLANRQGAFPRKHLLLNWIGRVNPVRPLFPDYSVTNQIHGGRVRGLGPGTAIGWGNTTTPLLYADGALRNFIFEDFCFESTANGARGLLLESDTSRNNQNIKWRNMRWQGLGWDYCIWLTGGVTANLNSELSFTEVEFSNGTWFSKGWLVMGDDGVSDPDNDGTANPVDAQEDQALNVWLDRWKGEASHGRYIVLNRGGNVHITNASLLHTGSSGTPTRGSTGEMVHIPISPVAHFDGAQMMSFTNVRTELRHAGSAIADIGWGSGGSVNFKNCSDGAKSYEFVPGLTEGYAVRNGCWVNFDESIHGAYVGLYGSAGGNIKTYRGRMVQGLTKAITDFSGTGHVRRASGTGGSATWTD